jgi:pyruvate,water dikinase
MRIAGHLEQAEDAVHLEVVEIEQWLGGRRDLREQVRTRKGQRLWARSHPPAAEEEPPLDLSGFPPAIRRMMRSLQLIMAHDAAPPEIQEGADGVGASPGIHTGPVRLIHTPEDLDRVEPGDVLVAPLTSSPWEFVFSKVGAVVSEGGGLLSHPAIVSREYGIPAVVGCAGATTRFTDGQVVTVDGSSGTVRVVDAM